MEEQRQQAPTITTPLVHHNHRPGRRKHSLVSELSGAVGDLGTFIPIVLTLTLVSNLDLSTTLIFTSLYNIATGLLFGLPMPVQPMKSIAAVAVSESPHLTTSQIAAAGLCTAATLFLLGLTGLMSFFYRFIPLPVVRGVQLSQGLSFAFTAIKYVRFNQDFATSKSTSSRPWLGLDGLLLALAAILFLVLTTGSGDYVSLTGSSAALGFCCGILLFLLLKLRSMECSRFGVSKFWSKSSAEDMDDSVP